MDINVIGATIKEKRELYGFTQKALATKARIARGFLSEVESGQKTPSIDALIRLAEALEVSPAEFFADHQPRETIRLYTLNRNEAEATEALGWRAGDSLVIEQCDAFHQDDVVLFSVDNGEVALGLVGTRPMQTALWVWPVTESKQAFAMDDVEIIGTIVELRRRLR